MTETQPDRTARMAAFLAETPDDRFPRRCRRLAQRYTLDTLGVAAFGAALPWSRAAAEWVGDARGTASAPATVIGRAWRTDAASAAFANGVAGHAFELDDVHDETILHPGAVVVPAALAVAEQTGATGHAFLAAVIAGYEAMARVGLAVDPAAHMLHGFHPTASCGAFGAAAAAGRLLGLDARGMTSALGLAASFASGLMEFSRSGGSVKRLHAGHPAESGVKAAGLAASGIEGPRRGLDGAFGFCRVFSPNPLPERLTEALGERWMIDEITVKPYACCSDVHPIIDALLALRARHGLRADDVEAITICGPRKVVEQNALDGTRSVMAAQYSAEYTAALTLLRDIEDPRIYSEETLSDPDLAALQARVTVRHDPAFDERYAWLISGRVTVDTRTGERLSETVHGARGSIHRPLDEAEVRGKFDKLVAGRLAPADARALAEAVRGLEQAADLRAVARGLARVERG
jgi:2-methylcitrate dehydratase PrpD